MGVGVVRARSLAECKGARVCGWAGVRRSDSLVWFSHLFPSPSLPFPSDEASVVPFHFMMLVPRQYVHRTGLHLCCTISRYTVPVPVPVPEPVPDWTGLCRAMLHYGRTGAVPEPVPVPVPRFCLCRAVPVPVPVPTLD